jgi:hypothetical protein
MGSEQDDVSNVMLFFARASAVFVGVAVLALIGLFIASRLSTGSSGSNAVPYNVDSRPLPKVSQVGELLPEQLGPFKRTGLKGTLPDFSATYTRGGDTITLAGSQAVSVRAAQAGVAQVARSSGRANTSQLTDTDPSYYLHITEGGPSRYAWSHNRWFFDIRASSRTALDDFMREFKY